MQTGEAAAAVNAALIEAVLIAGVVATLPLLALICGFVLLLQRNIEMYTRILEQQFAAQLASVERRVDELERRRTAR